MSTRPEYTPEDLQLVQGYEDETNEAVMTMEANIRVLAALRQYYVDLLENSQFDLRVTCKNDVLRFTRQLDDIVSETKMQVPRAQLLAKIIGDRKILVSWWMVATEV
jgi:hypothetical protein